jgi:hypothetical protein
MFLSDNGISQPFRQEQLLPQQHAHALDRSAGRARPSPGASMTRISFPGSISPHGVWTPPA